MPPIETDTTPAADAGGVSTATPAEVSEADLSRLAGDAFDRVMSDGGDGDDSADAATTEPAGQQTEAERLRDERGRFKAAEEAAAAADKTTAQAEPAKTEEAAAEGEPEPITFPTSWDVLKDEWATLPRSVQEKIAAREREINVGMSRLGREAAEAKRYAPLAPMAEVLSKHQEFMSGQDPAKLVDGLIRQQAYMLNNPEKALPEIARHYGVDIEKTVIGNDPAAAIRKIAASSGIDLLDLVLGNTPAPTQAQQPHPQLTAVEQRLQQTESQLSRMLASIEAAHQAETQKAQQAQAAREAEVNDAIDKLAAETPDFDRYAATVVGLLPAVVKAEPNLSYAAALKKALEQARWTDSGYREAQLQKQTAAKAKEVITTTSNRAAQAKKAASLNVKGHNGSAPPAAMSEASEIDRFWSANMGNA